MRHRSRVTDTITASSVALLIAGALALATPAAEAVGVVGAPALSVNPPALLTVTGSVSLDGTPTVGTPLAVVSTAVPSLPTAVLSGAWLRDGTPIPGATGSSYTPVTADLGSYLSFRLTASVAGLADAVVTSDRVGPVVLPPAGGSGGSGDSGGSGGSGGGMSILPAFRVAPVAMISGITGTSSTHQVGDTLVAGSGTPDPTPDLLAYQWIADGTEVPDATDRTFSLTADQLGARMSVRVTAQAAGWLPVSVVSSSTDPVESGTFTVGPTPTISGEVKVGHTLAADEGVPAPLADLFTYQWYADGAAIDAATQRTLLLTSDQVHRRISVTVTALRAGFVAVSGTSTETAPVATDQAPDLTLSSDHPGVGFGGTVRLTWSATAADTDTVAASGGWSGARPPSGSAAVRPARLGTTTYVLSASNDNGTTTRQVGVRARPTSKVLPVTASTGARGVSRTVRVRGSGLYPHEAYTLRVGRTRVVTGRAGAKGFVDRAIGLRLPARARHTQVRLTGMIAARSGRTDARSGRDNRLRVRSGTPRQGMETVRVSRLAPGEQVRLNYRGRQLLPATARANARGNFTTRLAVGKGVGRRVVSLVGVFSHRRGVGHFTARHR